MKQGALTAEMTRACVANAGGGGRRGGGDGCVQGLARPEGRHSQGGSNERGSWRNSEQLQLGQQG